jgi:hypothetical protein
MIYFPLMKFFNLCNFMKISSSSVTIIHVIRNSKARKANATLRFVNKEPSCFLFPFIQEKLHIS